MTSVLVASELREPDGLPALADTERAGMAA
jgi:hypothetical protein